VHRIPTLRIPRAASALVAAAVLSAGLGAAAPVLAGSTGFDTRMAYMLSHVSADPGYKRIPISTSEERVWFSDLAERLYSNKITKEQFVAEGVAKFPGYDASFSTIADLMTQK